MLEPYAGKKGGKDGVRLTEEILVTNGDHQLITLSPLEDPTECWLPQG